MTVEHLGSEVYLVALSARFASLIAVLGAADGEGGLLDHARQQSDGLAELAAQRRATRRRHRSSGCAHCLTTCECAVGQLPIWAQQAYPHAVAAGPLSCERCPDAGQTVTPVVLRDSPGVYLTALTCSVCQTLRLRSFDAALNGAARGG